MKKIFLAAVMVFILIPASWAEPKLRVIALKDGSSVQGRIMGIERGAYIIESSALGEIRVREDDVVSIVSPGDSVPATGPVSSSSTFAPASSGLELEAVQTMIMSDPALMMDIQAIAGDPEVMALISDPAFMQAVQAKDVAAIQSSERTMQLMANPKIKALIEKMRGDQGR